MAFKVSLDNDFLEILWPTFTELFAAKSDTAKGLASAYEVLLAGVPNEAGFTFLINSAASTNFGAGPGVTFNQENIFSFDNKVVLVGDEVTTGKHKIELVREGKGPLYFNAYLTNFTLEDFITKAGLEIKVNRNYFKLKKVDKKVKAESSSGRAGWHAGRRCFSLALSRSLASGERRARSPRGG